jgi:hypothetical protein
LYGYIMAHEARRRLRALEEEVENLSRRLFAVEQRGRGGGRGRLEEEGSGPREHPCRASLASLPLSDRRLAGGQPRMRPSPPPASAAGTRNDVGKPHKYDASAAAAAAAASAAVEEEEEEEEQEEEEEERHESSEYDEEDGHDADPDDLASTPPPAVALCTSRIASHMVGRCELTPPDP